MEVKEKRQCIKNVFKSELRSLYTYVSLQIFYSTERKKKSKRKKLRATNYDKY